MNSDEIRFCNLLTEIHQAALKVGASSDPRKWREAAATLRNGQKLPTKKSGGDCFIEDESGNMAPCERKSHVGTSPKGTYTGLSWKPTWIQQWDYIVYKKLGVCKYQFFDVFDPDTGELTGTWRMDTKILLELMKPRFKKIWERLEKKKRLNDDANDPRPSWSIGTRDILANSVQVFKIGEASK